MSPAGVKLTDATRQAEQQTAAQQRFLTGNIGGKANVGLLGNTNIFVKRFLDFCQEATAPADPETLQQKAGALIHEELGILQLAAERMHLETVIAERDTRMLQRQQGDLQGQIQVVEEEIARKQHELEQSKVYRQHQQEYEELKHALMRLPSRSCTAQDIAQVQADMAELQTDSDRIDRDMELRRKQFSMLGLVLRDLSLAVTEEAPGPNEGDRQPMDAD